MMSIRVSEQDEAKIHEKVASGLCPVAEMAMYEAVELLDERDRAIEWLNRELQIGLDQADRGELVNVTPELFAEIKEQIRREAGKKQRYKDAILP
jgi:hypothetical protein